MTTVTDQTGHAIRHAQSTASQGSAAPYRVGTESIRTSAYREQLDALIEAAADMQSQAEVARLLLDCSEATGGHVVVSPRLGFMPALIGSDRNPVFLYEFVEAIDGVIDYNDLREEFPLTYAQIHGAIAFLRRLATTNPRGIDIDDLESDEEARDSELIAALRRGLADQEETRVFDGE